MVFETQKAARQAGYYKHKGTGAVIYLEIDPNSGSTKIDAFIQVGFEYVGNELVEEVPSVEVTKEDVEPEVFVYTESVTKAGVHQYRKNGKLISKTEYENK